MTERDPPEPGPTWDSLVEMFVEFDVAETTAMLHALAPLVPEPWASRVRMELGGRPTDALPDWVQSVGEIEITGTWEQGDVMRDGENIVIGVRWPTGHEATGVTYIDHNLGTVVKDFIATLVPLAEVVDIYAQMMPAGGFDRVLDPAEARARIEAAVRRWSTAWPPVTNDGWPVARPVLLWWSSKLPDGGVAPEPEPMSVEQRERLIEAFLASPLSIESRELPGVANALQAVVGYGATQGPRDPLRWSPVRIELLLMDFLLAIRAPIRELAAVPDLLFEFIPWALHELRDRDGIDADLIEERIEEAFEAVDRWGVAFLRRLSGEEPVDEDPLDAELDDLSSYELVNLLLASDEELAPDVRARLEELLALGPDPSERELLLFELGGEEAAAQVHAEPWPYQTFDPTKVPDDLRERVAEIDRGLVDAFDELRLRPEHLTIARRILARVIEREPKALRRRGSSAGWVAGLLVIVADLNHLYRPHSDGTTQKLTKKAIAAAAGVKSVGEKDVTIGRAAGLLSRYHHVDLLDTRSRRELLDLLEELSASDEV